MRVCVCVFGVKLQVSMIVHDDFHPSLKQSKLWFFIGLMHKKSHHSYMRSGNMHRFSLSSTDHRLFTLDVPTFLSFFFSLLLKQTDWSWNFSLRLTWFNTLCHMYKNACNTHTEKERERRSGILADLYEFSVLSHSLEAINRARPLDDCPPFLNS